MGAAWKILGERSLTFFNHLHFCCVCLLNFAHLLQLARPFEGLLLYQVLRSETLKGSELTQAGRFAILGLKRLELIPSNLSQVHHQEWPSDIHFGWFKLTRLLSEMQGSVECWSVLGNCCCFIWSHSCRLPRALKLWTACMFVVSLLHSPERQREREREGQREWERERKRERKLTLLRQRQCEASVEPFPILSCRHF